MGRLNTESLMQNLRPKYVDYWFVEKQEECIDVWAFFQEETSFANDCYRCQEQTRMVPKEP